MFRKRGFLAAIVLRTPSTSSGTSSGACAARARGLRARARAARPGSGRPRPRGDRRARAPRDPRGRARNGERGAGSPRRPARTIPTPKPPPERAARSSAGRPRRRRAEALSTSPERACSRTAQNANTNGCPEKARHSAARSRTTWPFSRVFSAGSPMISARVRRRLRRPPPRTASRRRRRLSRIRVNAADVREAGSSATDPIFSRETLETRSTERTSEAAAMPRPGDDPQARDPLVLDRRDEPDVRLARGELRRAGGGTSRETETPGGGSWSRPQVRGRAFRKSTTEMRSIGHRISRL